MHEIVFWQDIVSPHMANLANELGALDCKLAYVALEEMSSSRTRQGWSKPDIKNVQLQLVPSPKEALSLLDCFPGDAIHLTQGVRGSGYIAAVVQALRQRHARWGAIMETLDERFGQGPLKRLVYAWHLGRDANRPDFILAIGEKMKPWLIDRGFPAERVFEFSYFLPKGSVTLALDVRPDGPLFVGFVGRLIKLKRVDLLIDALAGLMEFPFECVVAGAGPLEERLRERALAKLGPERFRMLGQLTMADARSLMLTLDCLVLPSDHDGWGAVVSEALMAGVPVICSDACGASTAVRASRVGGVFPKDDVVALREQLRQVFNQPLGIEKRQALAAWAHCFGTVAGASYLEAILNSIYNGADRPLPPWEANDIGLFPPLNCKEVRTCAD